MQIARPIARNPVKKSGGGPPLLEIPTCTVTLPVGVAPVPFTLSMITVIAPVAELNVPLNWYWFVRFRSACDVAGGSARYAARPEASKKYTSMFVSAGVTTWIPYEIESATPRVNVYPR